ncbi:MAG: ABC transporter ATP-binding protein [Pseudomonadota bacterium]|nr:ABC transporter ATP-binding protein [Pseudomonadota bacterium]
MLARALYRYVWRTSRPSQLVICVLTMIIAPLAAATLELQRRIIDDAVGSRNVSLLALLCVGYVGVICLRTGLKYVLSMYQGAAVETVARDLRLRIMKKARSLRPDPKAISSEQSPGTVVSLLGSETEDMSGFAGDAFSLPLLQGGTILFVVGYLLWVEPVIAILAMIVYFPQAAIVPFVQRTINRLGRLRITLARNLGNLALHSSNERENTRKRPLGSVLIDRLYRLRIWIYLRKYFLAELGNFLDNLGPIIVLAVGGYLAIEGKTQVGTLVVFLSGLQKISDPWSQIINFYRTVSNTAVMHDLIFDRLRGTPSTSTTKPVPADKRARRRTRAAKKA